MQPFFGAKIRGNIDIDQTESHLDAHQGAGSYHIKKEETAPLFQSSANMNWMNGAPNMSDFLLSRVNPSMNRPNTQPFESQKVGPGLGKEGGVFGQGGFNSGMEYRDIIKEKTVDDLRVKTNPKESFDLLGHQGPAGSSINNITETKHLGKVEKHNPDTFYMNTPDRWFTTGGAYQKDTFRSEQLDKTMQRETTNKEIYGNGGSTNKMYVDGQREQSKRINLPVNSSLIGIQTQGIQPHMGDFGDVQRSSQGVGLLANNRSMNPSQPSGGGLKSLVSAAVNPIMDIFKPTRKQELIANIKGGLNVSQQNQGSYLYNPYDTPRVTDREMTENGTGHLFVNAGQDNTGYMSTQVKLNPQQRTTTNTDQISGVGGSGNSYGNTSYVAAYNQVNNPNRQELLVNHPNQGGMATFNSNTGALKTNKLESDLENNRTKVPSHMIGDVHNVATFPQLQGTQYNYKDESKQTDDRMDPNLLKAFKENPYTKSLNSI